MPAPHLAGCRRRVLGQGRGLDLEKGPKRQDELAELVTQVEHRDEDRQQDHGDDRDVLDRLLGVDAVISASCTHVRQITCLGRRACT